MAFPCIVEPRHYLSMKIIRRRTVRHRQRTVASARSARKTLRVNVCYDGTSTADTITPRWNGSSRILTTRAAALVRTSILLEASEHWSGGASGIANWFNQFRARSSPATCDWPLAPVACRPCDWWSPWSPWSPWSGYSGGQVSDRSVAGGSMNN